MTPAEFTGHKEVVRLDRVRLEDGTVEINFEFRKQRYCYDSTEHSFERLRFPDKVNACENHLTCWQPKSTAFGLVQS